MNNMIAFHGDKNIQDKYLKRVQTHYELDEIIQGTYWENGKGCAVGCTIQGDLQETGGSWHKRYEAALGIPRSIAYLEDKIFEGLANGDAKKFPVKFLNAVPLGADLSQVTDKFLLWLLADKKDGVLQYAKTEQTKKAIETVIDLYKRKLKGETITTDQWITARRAAYAAYAAANDAYAAYAAYAAANDAYAAYAAANAAYAAYAAYAAANAARQKARTKHYKKMASKLISLIKAAK